MSKKPTAPAEKKPDATKAPAEAKKPTAKPPVNPFTAEHGRKLGPRGKSGPSRTAWKT